MRDEYDLKKLKKRPGPVRVISKEEVKSQVNMRLDSSDIASIKTEAYRLGIPYQTLIGSIIHRYVTGDLVDRESPDLKKLFKLG
jgi:predicted DNA binding CopG/RHH family protein